MIPVFLFAGFLGSGKTTLINDLLASDGIARVPTLLLLLEEGEEELSIPDGFQNLITVQTLPEASALNRAMLERLTLESGAGQVLIEYNGMWQLKELSGAFPKKWMLYQSILTADAETFLLYNQNMRALCADKLKICSIAMFNRLKPGQDTTDFRRLIRALNRKSDIYYEYANGDSMKDESGDILPYDISADSFRVEDAAFAVWQLDMNCYPEKYAGKTVEVRVQIYPGNMAGRRVMTCCEADTELVQFPLSCESGALPPAGSWAQIRAVIETAGSAGTGGAAGAVANSRAAANSGTVANSRTAAGSAGTAYGQSAVRLRVLAAEPADEPVPATAIF